jgi:hypothetical protein
MGFSGEPVPRGTATGAADNMARGSSSSATTSIKPDINPLPPASVLNRYRTKNGESNW